MDFKFITDDDQRVQAEDEYKAELIELKDQHKLQLDEEISGLKSKNAEILDEKKKIDAKMKEFDDYDFAKANEALGFLENNKDAQLIKDGKVEELIEKKTSTMRSDHETTLTELNSNLSVEKTRGNLYEGLYKTKMVEDALREAAAVAKVRTVAVTDILLRGRDIFSLAEDESIEARDVEGKLRKTGDDKVLTTTNWLEGLKKTCPHYWEDSKGAGADGGGAGDEGDLTIALNRAAEGGNMIEYRRLRKKQQG